MGRSLHEWPSVDLRWRPAYRIVPTRFPSVYLFDRVANAEDFEALYALEAMTNDRLRNELGQIDLVPKEERLYGNGSGPIMAAFTHLNPHGSRFSDGSYGVFYAAREKTDGNRRDALSLFTFFGGDQRSADPHANAAVPRERRR